ncbi:hypothetical protein DSUL_100165 [Desulfovibrionales bacterium]
MRVRIYPGRRAIKVEDIEPSRRRSVCHLDFLFGTNLSF